MKKKTVFFRIIFLLLTASVFCTEITTGLTYDTQDDSFLIGTDVCLKEDFDEDSSLSAELSYENEDVYTASLIFSTSLSRFLLSGGLRYAIRETGIIPFITAKTGIVFNDWSLIATGEVNLNDSNIIQPDSYDCSAHLILDSGSPNIDLSFLYNLNTADDGNISKIGGGLTFTAYQPGSPLEISIITDVLYVTDEVDGINGIALDGGAGINVNLSFMKIKLCAMAEAMDPERDADASMPYSITFSTSFVL